MAKEHKLSDYDFKFGDALNKSLATHFKTLEVLIDTDIAEIMTSLKITRPKAKKIQIYANELLGDIKKKGDAAVHTKIDRPLKTSVSSKEAVSDEDEEDDDSEDKENEKYVVTEVPVDKFNTIRRRVLLTPAVCPKCGLDLIELNRLVSYEDLSDSDKLKIRQAVDRHVTEDHVATENRIITRSEMDKSTWLHPTV